MVTFEIDCLKVVKETEALMDSGREFQSLIVLGKKNEDEHRQRIEGQSN